MQFLPDRLQKQIEESEAATHIPLGFRKGTGLHLLTVGGPSAESCSKYLIKPVVYEAFRHAFLAKWDENVSKSITFIDKTQKAFDGVRKPYKTCGK